MDGGQVSPKRFKRALKAQAMKSTLPSRELVELVLDQLDGALIVDAQARVVLITPRYADFLGVDPRACVGLPVDKVIPNTRMDVVIRTGQPEIADIWEVKGQTVVVSRIPIYKDGKVIGAAAFSVFRGLDQARDFARRLRRLDAELGYYREELRRIRGAKYSFNHIVGRSDCLRQAVTMAKLAARNNSTVLLLGETGTGKELFAHAIHQESPRRYGPFIRVNCAAIPAELMEAELFGYEEGAFTGARKGGKPGKFELAHQGTLFLDEVEELPLPLQAKLLRALQDMEIDRVGGLHPKPVDVRVIAASNDDLSRLVKEKRFRPDLYYRLAVVTIEIPPLRQRPEDIPLLAEAILARLNQEMGVNVQAISPEALDLLRAYSWPGNVREMENILQRVLNVVSTGEITCQDLIALAPRLKPPADMLPGPGSAEPAKGNLGSPGSSPKPGAWLESTTLDLRRSRKEAERQAIGQALEMAGGNKSRAAALLGVHRSVLYRKIKRYHL
ncbi:MAG: sigma 54-interacting transcriptional regulator [Clostridia bacterium]|nr:sigma 54-interacting transcriptional regulator [Clostridia bacterium]